MNPLSWGGGGGTNGKDPKKFMLAKLGGGGDRIDPKSLKSFIGSIVLPP